ncbi:MAG: hypothetical protein JW776_05630 [Candidatus Lokiarchaeota archaeon]|nr:hypothetical protein [Candidatus Lokiarchaeota archaeon]
MRFFIPMELLGFLVFTESYHNSKRMFKLVSRFPPFNPDNRDTLHYLELTVREFLLQSHPITQYWTWHRGGRDVYGAVSFCSGINQYLVMCFGSTSEYYLENSLLTLQKYLEDNKMQERLLNSLFSLDAELPLRILREFSTQISQLLKLRNAKYYSNDTVFIP